MSLSSYFTLNYVPDPPTNWGLTEQTTARWRKELKEEGKGPDYDTTYRTSYNDGDVHSAAQSRRFAIPRELSVHFHPNNRFRIPIRGQQHKYAPLQIPEPPHCNIYEQIKATHCKVQEEGRRLQEKLNELQEPKFAPQPCSR